MAEPVPSGVRTEVRTAVQQVQTEVQAELFGALFVLLQHLSRRVDESLAPLGLSSRQWLLLAVLQKAFPGGSPTLTEAAAVYGSSRQNVKQLAVQLADRGYLALDPDPDDRRALRLRLTEKVVAFDEPKRAAEQAAVLADVFAALAPGDLRSLRDLVVRCLATQPSRP